jgi:Ubiquitin-activating enzyme E1 FCCH domain
MTEQIYIGNFSKGLKLDRLPFNIDNDNFPTLFNFYSWRGRAKRKRGTFLLGQLERQLDSVASPNNWEVGPIGTLNGSGDFSGNLITIFSLQDTSTITPGSITFSDGTNTYTEDSPPDGILVGSPGGTGTINYATGAITISGGAPGGTLVGTFSYYPGLPVMGLRDFVKSTSTSLYPLLVAFDTTYAYQINQSVSNFFYSVSYYKDSENPVTWTAPDYSQFWTTNYSGAMWATNNNGNVAASLLQFEVIATITVGSPTIITTSSPHGLVTGDYVWFNEITGTDASDLNGKAAEITVTGSMSFTVPIDTTGDTISNSGIFQTLTATSPTSTGDGIRWYDGDPTGGTGLPVGSGLGWVNFAPPLTAATVSIDNTPPRLYYLVGALAIVPYKDRLLFFSPWIQASTGSAIQLEDTVIWSWNGTPYYTVDSSGDPLLVPSGETASLGAYYVDQTGKGGWQSAGISQPILTVTNNEDVLIVGFSSRFTRLVYTGNDIFPFVFFAINSELGSTSTFSGITLDRGGVTVGTRAITITTQQSCQRIDLDIPDSVFQISGLNNGTQRVNAARDYFKEWIYFNYTSNDSPWVYPNLSFLWNYRDNTWGIQYENFTAQGTFRGAKNYTWATLPFPTWAAWRETWNSGSTQALFPSIIGGNPQGYVLVKGQGTGEGVSGTIIALASSMGNTEITSTNHCVNVDDYIQVMGAIGLNVSTITAITNAGEAVVTTSNSFVVGQTVILSGVEGMTEINGNPYVVLFASGTSITLEVDSTAFGTYTSGGTVSNYFNGQIGKVISTPDADHFILDLPFPTGTYLGLGQYVRLSQPLLQTKQFPFYWDQGRQVRLSVQKYLMDYTANGQVTVNIYLSQDPDDVWNSYVTNPPPTSLVYSQTMYTCPESTNIGLTPSNVNLQMPTAEGQFQIWHRMNTSLIGDTFQIGLTLDDSQMRNYVYATSEITLHGIILSVDKGPHLS